MFDALQKKYLEVAMLEIYDKPSCRKGKGGSREGTSANPAPAPKLIECFVFTVSCGKAGGTLHLATGPVQPFKGSRVLHNSLPVNPKSVIKQSTANIVSAMIPLLRSLAPLPSSHSISMKVCFLSFPSPCTHRWVLMELSNTSVFA